MRDPKPGDEYRTRFQDTIANLATPLWGISKDLLYGESIRQHRRTMRLARRAVIVLAALTIAAVLSGDILAAAYDNQVVALWNVQSPKQPSLFSAFPAEGPLGIAVAISPDGSILAASGTGTAVQLWDITKPGILGSWQHWRIGCRCAGVQPRWKPSRQR